ncbi:MerR family transcriptional regulator [Mobilicoccus massiliensis]|uniref:MerR family transcriptional regulator n=1 Tax=Mobilicoccus massiliensis TaxID=1522310 RepID=UPI001FE84587|nr:MerR family transcriptional regulator [Mobilicoccus massiliensis]
MSALSAETGVPVATLKYYLREGLVPPGVATSRNQAQYDETHVERVRLVRALTEVGGLDLATVARVLATIESPDVDRLGVLGASQRALLGADFVDIEDATDDADGRVEGGGGDTTSVTSRARAWAAARGWQLDRRDPVLDELDRAWAACDAAGIGLDEQRMDAYGDAAELIARIDVASVPAAPRAAVRQVVLGTVLVDPVLSALRRLAQQHVAVSAHGGRREGAEGS